MFENAEKKYQTLNDFLRQKFNQKVFKVPLNAYFTCPNKDGSKALGGCIFCSPSGSGDFAGSVTDDLRTQYESVKKRMEEKWPDSLTIGYFQANTNTHASVEVLKRMYEEVLTFDSKMVGLSIATRCDALDDGKIALLKSLNEKTWVQIELGLQTIHQETAEWMNRAHSLECFDQAVKKLRNAGIDVVVHIINGFPKETHADMLETSKYLNTLDIQGVKIHMLHIMEKTALGTLYKEAPFPLLSREEYVSIVVNQLEHLNPNIVIHRVTGDAPKSSLIAPEWTLKKFVVMNEIDKRMRKLNTYQGKALEIKK